MCGWAGFLDPRREQSGDDLRATAARMAATLVHRGPDDSGAWGDPRHGIALAARRLAVIDVSSAGHQPMHSASGRYVIAYNGEIYNAAHLRRSLEEERRAPAWRGHSDTEVMLAAIEAWGIRAAVKRFVGMFAFALWDAQEMRLFLVRDRIGVKPLHYGYAGSTFLFGSELKALRAHPSFDAAIDLDAVVQFLRTSYIPAPLTIDRGIRKLPPGTILELDGMTGREVSTTHYWSLREVAEEGVRNRFRGSEEDALGELDGLLKDAVASRLIADVPIGVFLSGGVDSSLVTALMQAASAQPVKTFSIGVHDGALDEARHAREVARHLGTEHTELYVTAQDALAVVPHLPRLYDEPFADSSQIPTYLVSQLARRQVTVSLSGDGGDELFGGYTHYLRGRAAWRAMSWMPLPARRAAARAIGSRGDRRAKLAALLAAEWPAIFYRRLWSRWPDARAIVAEARQPATFPDVMFDDAVEQMMFLDQTAYLPDDILVKVDRASMGASLEVRAPLLDHRLVAFAWSLPPAMKVRGGRGKWLLARLLERYVPEPLARRPKMGFSVPIGAWLRGPLREWAEDLLDAKRMEQEGILVAAAVRRKWDEHVSGKAEWPYHLWDILMFQAWLRSAR